MEGFDSREEGAHYKIVELVGKNKKVLEIGCGAGHVSKKLKENGCGVTAIELEKEHAKKAKRFCNRVFLGNAETMKMPFKKESFDVVLFADVLEHLVDPKATLKRVRPFLKNSGKIVASIPNIANWKVRLKLLFGKFDYEDWGILDRTHLRFFTKKTAKQLIESTGYTIVEEDYTPSFPFPFFKKQLAKVYPKAFAFQFIFVGGKK